jgi:hypothetical protein
MLVASDLAASVTGYSLDAQATAYADMYQEILDA